MRDIFQLVMPQPTKEAILIITPAKMEAAFEVNLDNGENLVVIGHCSERQVEHPSDLAAYRDMFDTYRHQVCSLQHL